MPKRRSLLSIHWTIVDWRRVCLSGAARVVQPQPVPVAAREAGAVRGHRAHHHAGLKLVQEPQAEGPRLGGNRVRKDKELLIAEIGCLGVKSVEKKPQKFSDLTLRIRSLVQVNPI